MAVIDPLVEEAPPPVKEVPGKESGRTPRGAWADLVRKAAVLMAVLAVLVGLYEGYKAMGQATGGEWPFVGGELPVATDDTSMPHAGSVVGSLFAPVRRGDDKILLVLLAEAGWFTLREALVGFTAGVLVGVVLAVIFLQAKPLERGLMPFVVASQTVPLIAIAPMVVIWGGQRGWPAWVSVAIISGYLAFFPVVVNTLRGLQSPGTASTELMRSYAATRWQTLVRLRFPAALPYFFVALRIAATASVVGAIVGELPAGIPDGLGRALLTFTSFYVTGPEKLYAAVLGAAAVGLVFVGLVTLLERTVMLRRRGRAA